jgi:eukaryotic translation initiation factor 2C
VNGDQQYRDYDLSPVLSALNIVLYAYAARSGTRSVEIGRNKFFFPDVTQDSLDLGGGLEAWKVGFLTNLFTWLTELLSRDSTHLYVQRGSSFM